MICLCKQKNFNFPKKKVEIFKEANFFSACFQSRMSNFAAISRRGRLEVSFPSLNLKANQFQIVMRKSRQKSISSSILSVISIFSIKMDDIMSRIIRFLLGKIYYWIFVFSIAPSAKLSLSFLLIQSIFLQFLLYAEFFLLIFFSLAILLRDLLFERGKKKIPFNSCELIFLYTLLLFFDDLMLLQSVTERLYYS